MNTSIGYIYVRNHPSYDDEDACKLGKATNIPERDSAYATGEITRGYFEVVFQLPNSQMGFIERLLQHEFFEFEHDRLKPCCLTRRRMHQGSSLQKSNLI